MEFRAHCGKSELVMSMRSRAPAGTRADTGPSWMTGVHRLGALLSVRGALQENRIGTSGRVRAVDVGEQFDAVTQPAPYVAFQGYPGKAGDGLHHD